MEISEDLKDAYQSATRRDDRASCPSAEELTALVEAALPAERRDAVVDHLVGCSECALEVRLARGAKKSFLGESDFLSESEAPAGAPSDSTQAAPVALAERRRPGRLRPRWLALAAALVLAVGLTWQLRGPQVLTPAPAGVERSAPTSGDVSPPHDAAVAALPENLSWPAEAGAEAYRVEIFDDGARSLWRSDWVGAASSPVPAGLVEKLGAGSYLWRVEVRGPAARRELGPYVFTIR